MLEINALRKAYGDHLALQGVSFTVPRGTCYGLLGPNGAGKTTTIFIITGTLDADSGSITLEGSPIGTGNLAIRRRIGYVPQDLALYEDISAVDNLKFFGTLYGLSGAALDSKIEKGLELAGLKDRKKGPVKAFSGGMKRRLNIAAALLHDPDFIVLDEPTVGVDPQSRNLIFEALEALVAEGKTLLYTTHYMEEAERLCQRAAIMDHGKVIAEGELSELHKIVPAEHMVHLQFKQRYTGSIDNIPGVRQARYENGTLALELTDISKDLNEALAELSRRGALISDIRSERPTLEEVFLHLTGRTLRD
ncbi:MAG TPA: ABC transporter ATP-binding protein [Fimbriimonadaceae bacterium]